MLIVLNHKMNLKIEEIKNYERILRDYDVVVMPQTPYMGLFSKGKYILGSQCISEYNAPGGISADALVSLNVGYVIVGHAERRALRGECDKIIAEKITQIINNGMIPILCVGESLSEKESKLTMEVIQNQIDNVFNILDVPRQNIIIAYEPVWSIGTKHFPGKDEIEEVLSYIRKHLEDAYGTSNKLIYGGSVNSANIKELKEVRNLKGVLVGSASLNIEEVIKIYEATRG